MKTRKTSEITSIIVHCSGTPKNKDFTVVHIDEWHRKDPVNPKEKIGYHYVIRLNGNIEIGRSIEEVGAHALGYNETSVGLCYIGGGLKGSEEDTRTEAQKKALITLIKELIVKYPSIKRILGHRDTGSTKKCPCFDAKSEYGGLLKTF